MAGQKSIMLLASMEEGIYRIGKEYKNRKEYRGGCCTNGYNNKLSWGQPFQIFIPCILSIICTESYIYC